MKTCSSEIQYPLFSKLVMIAFAITFLIMGIKLVLLDPIIGLANNGDFQRNMSEVGLWFCGRGTMSDCQISHEQMYFRFTINNFYYSEPAQSGMWTPYGLFLALSRSLAYLFSPSYYDIRFIGAINLFLYWSGVIALISQIRVDKKLPLIVQVIIAIGFVFFVSDSYILQYFNSFYAEPISLISTIWFFALFLAISNHKTRKVKYFLLILQMIIGVVAASAKQQDMLIIFTLTVILLIEWFCFFTTGRTKTSYLSFLVGILIVIIMIGSNFFSAGKNIAGAYMCEYNIVMNGLLPYSSKQEQLLTKMGFSANQAKELVPYIGQTIFSNNAKNEYPDLFDRRNEIKIILADPIMLVKSIVARSKDLFTDTVYGNFQESDNLPPYSKLSGYSRIWWQLIQLLFSRSLVFYLFIVLASIGLGIFQFVKYGYHTVYLLLVSLSITNVFRFMVVMLGDANEDAKHLFMTNIEFFIIFILFVYCLIHLIKRVFQNPDSRVIVLVDNSSSLQ